MPAVSVGFLASGVAAIMLIFRCAAAAAAAAVRRAVVRAVV